MVDNGKNEIDAENRGTDFVIASMRGFLGMVPVVGPLVVELVGEVIPDRRINRLSDLIDQIERRLGALEAPEKVILETRFKDERFGDLMEQALRDAAGAVSAERRSYLAGLVVNGLTSDQISDTERKHLLRILGDLNDIEIIWLRFFLVPTQSGDVEFREQNAEVIRVYPPTMSSSQEEIDRYAISESYKHHLVRLGLLSEEYDRGGNPRRKISSLGRLLIREIGLGGD